METKKAQYRRVRGAILKMLAKEHPGEVDSKVVHLLIKDLGLNISEAECNGHIAYLTEKGFVKKDERRSGGIEITLVGITAAGLDLLDDFITDVGVETGGLE